MILRNFAVVLILLTGAASGAVLRQRICLASSEVSLTTHNGITTVSLPDAELTDEPGNPELVRKAVSINLPAGIVVRSVRVREFDEVTIAEDVTLPVSQPQTITMPGITPRRVEANTAVLSSPQPYPSELIRFAGQGMMDGENLALVIIYPVRYYPLERRLTFLKRLDFELVGEPSDLPDQPPAIPAFDYVIITNSALDSVFQRLAQWKTQKGVRTVIRDIAWIQSSYPGRDGAERLRNYLKACYPDSGLRYVLLGGDVGIVPLRYAFAMACSANLMPREDSLPCDLYYSDLNGDWDYNGNDRFGEVADSIDLFPDVFVGRAPVNTPEQARTFVNKVLTYEQPTSPDYLTSALFCAEILWDNPYTDQAIAKNYIDNHYLPEHFRPVTKLYQSHGTENLDTVIGELNRGHHLFNHNGHGSTTAMSVGGSPNYLRCENIAALTNAPRYGICYSIGCWTAAFDLDAIAEHYLRAPNGGGVAFIGNASYGWGAPGNPRFGYSDRFDAEFYRQLFAEKVRHIGRTLAMDKAHFIPYSRAENVYRWHQYELNLLGDPEMPIWTDTPRQLSVTAPSALPAGATVLTVLVRDSVGTPVGNAIVCAQKPDECYIVAQTNGSGQAMLRISTASAGNVTVTVTADNFLPRIVTLPVTDSAFVVPHKFTINDSGSNADSIPNPGETTAYEVWLSNDGSYPVRGLTSRLSYTGEALSVTDSIAHLPDLAPKESCRADFSLAVSPWATDRQTAVLSLIITDSSAHTWSYSPAVTIGAPRLNLKDYLPDDSPPVGNGNGVFEPGEQVNLTLRLSNTGLGYAYDPRATISSLDPNISVITAHTSLGTIPPDSWAVAHTPVSVAISSSCPDRYAAVLLLAQTSAGITTYDTLPLMVGANGLDENFDSGASGWTSGGTRNQWHLSDTRFHSPQRSFYCGTANQRYENGTNCWLLSPEFVVGPESRLSFYHWFHVPIYGSDGLYVIVERGTTAETLDYIGTGGALGERVKAITNDWFQEEYDLGHYRAGEAVRLRFAFKSDDDGKVGEGFYLDDVKVTSSLARISGQLPSPIPAEIELSSAPNPFRRLTTIMLGLPFSARVTARIYSSDGRVLATLLCGSQSAGYRQLFWPGTNAQGKNLPNGIYLCEVVVNHSGAVIRRRIKLVLAR